MTTAPTSPRDPVVDAVGEAQRLLAAGEPLKDVWRYAVVQLLDDYTSVPRRRGVAPAAALWGETPEPTGDVRVDVAFAALAEHLARRDGWEPPPWASDPSREALEWWFVTDLVGMHPAALVESPCPSANAVSSSPGTRWYGCDPVPSGRRRAPWPSAASSTRTG